MKQETFIDAAPVVTLIDYTGASRYDKNWHAADVMIFSKSTRLNMTPDLFQQVKAMKTKDKLAELDAMSKTIPSSWEFADVAFLISGVTRACAQQITRTRTGSYAMQSQRVVDVSGAGVRNSATDPSHRRLYDEAVGAAMDSYSALVSAGVPLEDARGLLPMNIKCNLMAKYNFRSFVELVRARSSMRTQDEYGLIIQQMKQQVLDVWPWSHLFFREPQEAAISILEGVAKRLQLTTGKGDAWEIAKAIDLIRKS